MALHNRLIPSVQLYATQRAVEVNNIASKWPDSELVQRWAKKYDDLMVQHNLLLPDEQPTEGV